MPARRCNDFLSMVCGIYSQGIFFKILNADCCAQESVAPYTYHNPYLRKCYQLLLLLLLLQEHSFFSKWRVQHKAVTQPFSFQFHPAWNVIALTKKLVQQKVNKLVWSILKIVFLFNRFNRQILFELSPCFGEHVILSVSLYSILKQFFELKKETYKHNMECNGAAQLWYHAEVEESNV